MLHAKVFKSGNSQAVRLPKEYAFDVAKVEIHWRENEGVLRKRRCTGQEVFEDLVRIALPADIPDVPAETWDSFCYPTSSTPSSPPVPSPWIPPWSPATWVSSTRIIH